MSMFVVAVVVLLLAQVMMYKFYTQKINDLKRALEMRDILLDDGSKTMTAIAGSAPILLGFGDTLSVRHSNGLHICDIRSSNSTSLTVIA